MNQDIVSLVSDLHRVSGYVQAEVLGPGTVESFFTELGNAGALNLKAREVLGALPRESKEYCELKRAVDLLGRELDAAWD